MPIALRKIEDEIELRGGPLWAAIERERESRAARAPETKPVVSMSSKLLELFNDDDFILGAMQAVASEDDSLWDGPTIKMAVNFAESTYNKYSSIISEREYGEERFWVALVITAVCLGKPNFAKNLKGGLIERTFVGEDLLNKLIEKVLTTPDIIDKVKAKLEQISTKTEALEALENQVKENKNMQNIVETKRETKRYYVRPQNIFCANKADILNALIKVGTDNCSVYSLKRLEDHDDVHLLSPKDIIYYYDDGILYDKNHVKVMDYDLFVKHEEDRKRLANPNAVSDAVFDKVYKDRLTENTELAEDFADGKKISFSDLIDLVKAGEEYEVGYTQEDSGEVSTVGGEPYACTTYTLSHIPGDDNYLITKEIIGHHGEVGDSKDIIVNDRKALLDLLTSAPFDECYVDFSDAILDEAFKQYYKPRNVFGESYDDEHYTCCICGEEFDGYGNNPAPVKEDGRCCDACNRKFVIPARLEQMGIHLDNDED